LPAGAAVTIDATFPPLTNSWPKSHKLSFTPIWNLLFSLLCCLVLLLLLLLCCIIIIRFQNEIGATARPITIAITRWDTCVQHLEYLNGQHKKKIAKKIQKTKDEKISTFGMQFAFFVVFFLFFFFRLLLKVKSVEVYRDLMYVKVTCALKSCLI